MTNEQKNQEKWIEVYPSFDGKYWGKFHEAINLPSLQYTKGVETKSGTITLSERKQFKTIETTYTIKVTFIDEETSMVSFYKKVN
tara:strand:- start:3223 stop:3477 length:255 start_codon:yes stop_codon:yes gene_type:complete